MAKCTMKNCSKGFHIFQLDTLITFHNMMTDLIKEVDRVNISFQTYITFDGTNVNTGNAFDPATGIFRAPRAGIYAFSFHALTQVRNNILFSYLK